MTTIIGRTALGPELAKALYQINAQITEVEHTATEMNIDPVALRDTSGNWPMVQLLGAKAQILNALVLFNEKGK